MKFSLNFFSFLRSGNDRGGVFLVPMHGGIWTLCINLRDDEIRELGKKGFPAYPQCFNYLAGNIDNSRSGGVDEPRADWQHSESQTPIRPHLSRYNRNVLASINPSPTSLYAGILLSLLLPFLMCTDIERARNFFNIQIEWEKLLNIFYFTFFSFSFASCERRNLVWKNRK